MSEYVRAESGGIKEMGEYDQEGLLMRRGLSIDSIGARRVVIDTVDSSFLEMPNHASLRSTLRRLVRWLTDRGAAVISTGEMGISPA